MSETHTCEEQLGYATWWNVLRIEGDETESMKLNPKVDNFMPTPL